MEKKIFLPLFILVATFQFSFAQSDSSFINAIKGMKVYKGAITIYEKPGAYYFELPSNLIGKDLLWYAEIKKAPLVTGMMASYASSGKVINSFMINFEKRDNKVFIRNASVPLDLRLSSASMSSEDLERMKRSLGKINSAPIILTLAVIASNADGSLLVDANPILGKNLPFFDLSENIPLLSVHDPGRSYVEEIQAFSNSIRFSNTLTFGVAKTPNESLININAKSATVSIAHSIYILPELLMAPRLADPRIGYFKTGFTELKKETGNTSKAYISKYRLEKKNPNAKISEPIKPIVYYIGPDVPARWRPVFKEAVEAWNVAFEEIGFKNAIVAKDPPSDPNWSPDDLGHSVIRWVNQPIANAMGPSTVDPRTGEILSAHVLIWEDVFSIAKQWYYLQGGSSDKRAAKFPFPEALENSLMKYVVQHEVGHSIGLRHNHRASQAYTTKELRDKKFTDTYGPVASLMSYGRMNYIAQPEDKVTNIIPQIGPYDLLVIKYGYDHISGVSTPEAEIPVLNKWLEVQRTDPRLLWSAEDQAAQWDPNVLTENIGNDRIEAARLGLLNLQRAVNNLPFAIGQGPQDIDKLKNYYEAALGERDTWLTAAAKELYGFKEFRYLDPTKEQFVPVSGNRKKEVLQYLLSELKNVSPLFTEEMKKLYPPVDYSDYMFKTQLSILEKLMSAEVFKSFVTAEVLTDETYTTIDYMNDVTNGIFSELTQGSGKINPVRRQLQYLLVIKLINFIEQKPENSAVPTTQMAARSTLKKLYAGLQTKLNAGNKESEAHLMQMKSMVAKGLGIAGD